MRQQKEQSDWRKRERRGTRNERQERLRGPREDQRAPTFRDPASLAPSLRVQREQRRLSSSRSRTRLSGSPCSSRAPAVSPAPRCSSSPLTVSPTSLLLPLLLVVLPRQSVLLPFPHSPLVLPLILSCRLLGCPFPVEFFGCGFCHLQPTEHVEFFGWGYCHPQPTEHGCQSKGQAGGEGRAVVLLCVQREAGRILLATTGHSNQPFLLTRCTCMLSDDLHRLP